MEQLPASASRKGTASLHVKVNTGARGNVLPLCVFKHLYPNWISPAGLPTSLDHISTRLSAYNRSHIPLYGTHHGPITWQPGGPGTWPHKVHSYWYVADTPGPVILGLPSCKRVAVAKMNCAITVAQPDTKPPSPAPAPTATADNPSNLLMTWLRSFQIDSQGLADSLVSTPSDSIMMFIPSYMSPESAPLPYAQRSRSTLTKWNAWEW